MKPLITAPVNPNAQQGVKNGMAYLAEISGYKIITGQHTQSMAQEEMHHIKAITGKLPALLGFELLSYSTNINYLDTDDECMEEVCGNYGTLRQAWEWAAQKGVLTLIKSAINEESYPLPDGFSIDEAYDFVLRAIHLGAKIEGIQRKDIYELPIDVIRELICNAICHRSYLEPVNVQVILFDDIDYVDYKLNVFHKAETIFLGVGSLIIENKTQKFVIRNVEGVRDCYETIIEAQKEYRRKVK